MATLLRDSGSRRGLACLQPSQIRSSEAPSQSQPGTWWPQQPSRPWRTSASGAATWARRSFLLARDFTDTALEEPGWIEDPTALGLARESQEVGLQLDRLDDLGPDESVMEQ